MKQQNTINSWWNSVALALCGVVLSVAAQAGGNGTAAQNTGTESTALQADETITLFDTFTLGETIPLPMCPQNRWSSFGKGCVYLPERLEIFEDLPIASMVDRLGLYEYREGQYPVVASTSHMFTLGVDEQDRLMYLRVTTRGQVVQEDVLQMLTMLLGKPVYITQKENDLFNLEDAPEGAPAFLWAVTSRNSVVAIWHNQHIWARFIGGLDSNSEIGFFDIGLNRILKDGQVPRKFW